MIECARCGYKNDAAAKFCAACGAPMMAAQAPPAMPQPAWGQPVWGAPAVPQQPVPQNWGPAPPPAQPAPHWGAPQQPAPQAGYGAPSPLGMQMQPQYAPAPQQGYPAAPQAYPPQQQAYPQQGYPSAAQGPAVPPPAEPAQPGYANPYGAPPWGAPAPIAVAPVWGQAAPAPTAAPESPALSPTVPETAEPIVVPTAASAVIAPLEADQVPPNAPKTLAAFLVTFETNPLGDFWPIHQGSTVIGRKESGAGLDLEIDHPTTSSRHATVYAAARPGRLKVEDLGSTNGTYVNERRLEPGEHRPLEQGDTLRFGGFSVAVHLV